jgi:hypothetical protein
MYVVDTLNLFVYVFCSDLAEFTLAFAYSYDWMYDAWTEEQRTAIMWSIINLGLNYGLNSYTDQSSGYSWWQTTNGNWNNVCNGGLTLGALAVATEDPTGTAQQLLSNTIANVKLNGATAVQPDGTWTETSDYWYFGTTGFSQMVSGLITATGSDQGLLDANPSYNLTGLFHMYGTGFVQKFNYGDCGPNKYTATANGLILFADQFNSEWSGASSRKTVLMCGRHRSPHVFSVPTRQTRCSRTPGTALV